MKDYSTDAASRRPRHRRSVLALAGLVLGLAGCSAPYDPPVRGDHVSARYTADLAKCRSDSAEQVRIRNADTPATWIKSAFTGSSEVGAAIRTCMEAKGYTLEPGAAP